MIDNEQMKMQEDERYENRFHFFIFTNSNFKNKNYFAYVYQFL